MNVYADNAATTKMCAAAIKEMLPYLVSSGCNNGFQDINNEMNALVTVRK